MSNQEPENKRKEIGFGPLVVVFICTFACILVGIIGLGTSAQMPPVITSAIAVAVGVAHEYKYSEMEERMSETIKASAPAILIIGMVIGTWILGGIVLTMIYYGLSWISPKIFLLASCLLCTIVSTFTGSSWATMGIMGVGQGLDMPLGMTVGTIISDAYFGDKMSPLSDTTNLAPAMVRITVFSHKAHYTSQRRHTASHCFCTAFSACASAAGTWIWKPSTGT